MGRPIVVLLAGPLQMAADPAPPPGDTPLEETPVVRDEDGPGGVVGGVVGRIPPSPIPAAADNPYGAVLFVPAMSVTTTHAATPRRPWNPAWPEGPVAACVVLVDIDRAGTPLAARAIRCPADFVKTSVAAAMEWRFAPWLDENGAPIVVRTEVTITYAHP